eukprot:gnl/MRDRNA2_/MRDRNA2_65528_c0_seq2.p1 gnl/MRDRNA2_/MRDRNA2_65528_c0~~gnl/MRDRNA2_/MRDRNA2_65528_c0_seq2.p1  ORF type:complete len:288 (+),score=52.43 gnl/MRDRNA2_/MRDRNA2_65528_c0_seq2:77-940(+)
MVTATNGNVSQGWCYYNTNEASPWGEGYANGGTTAGGIWLNDKVQQVCETPTGGGAGVSGDPKVTNLAGERFDILALGTFSMLSIAKQASRGSFQEQKPLLDVTATIDRASSTGADPLCSATYIQNVTMQGKWIEGDNSQKVRIRATPGVMKKQALEIGLNDEAGINWYTPSELKGNLSQVPGLKKASWEKIVMNISGIEFLFTIDAHRIRDGSKGKGYANFLNMHIKGMNSLKPSLFRVTGLLAYDDHLDATKAPDGCSKKHNFMDTSHFANPHREPIFLSSVQLE